MNTFNYYVTFLNHEKIITLFHADGITYNLLTYKLKTFIFRARLEEVPCRLRVFKFSLRNLSTRRLVGIVPKTNLLGTGKVTEKIFIKLFKTKHSTFSILFIIILKPIITTKSNKIEYYNFEYNPILRFIKKNKYSKK